MPQWWGPSLLRSPLFLIRTERSDIAVAYHGSAVRRVVVLRPTWVSPVLPESAYDHYAYPDADGRPAAALCPDMSCTLPSWATRAAADAADFKIETTAWGWPAVCLAGTERRTPQRGPGGALGPVRSSLDGYWVFDGDPATLRVRRLPLRPAWPGLIACTAFYAAGWSTLLLGPRAAVGLARRRRGLCPRCGYDLCNNPTPGCPECGWNRPST